jgi:hypothetical protein
VTTVVFEAELGFQRVVDRFDDGLPELAQLRCATPPWLVGVGGSDEFDTVVGESAFELGGDVAPCRR